MRTTQPHHETPAEERWSSITHGVGAFLSLAALVILVTLAGLRGGATHVVGVAVFGVALLWVYVASTLYHACPRERMQRAKHCLKVLDHIGIYFLIAGTYTPFLLVIRGPWGWGLLCVLWGLAVAGTIFKLYFVNRFDVVSTIVYVAMGWIGVIAAKPFLAQLPGGALAWLLAGGITYTTGVIFYFWDQLPFNHAVWHVFVMGGSACHFLAVLFYVLPR
jgi:hemolysin III